MTNRWTQRISGGDPRIGMWVASGSSYVTEICAGSGIDWLMLDQEHAPNDLRTTLEQLQVLGATRTSTCWCVRRRPTPW